MVGDARGFGVAVLLPDLLPLGGGGLLLGGLGGLSLERHDVAARGGGDPIGLPRGHVGLFALLVGRDEIAGFLTDPLHVSLRLGCLVVPHEELGIPQDHVGGDSLELLLPEAVLEKVGLAYLAVLDRQRGDEAGIGETGEEHRESNLVRESLGLGGEEASQRGGVHGAVAGGDGVDVGGEVEEGGLDGEERGVCDMELGLVALDEEVVRSLERAEVLANLGLLRCVRGIKPELA